jgi:Magnesium chelatase, subunit ChlI
MVWLTAAAGRDFTGPAWRAVLDELPEFNRAALEALREPMETGRY